MLRELFLEYVKDKPWFEEAFIIMGLTYLEQNESILEKDFFTNLYEKEKIIKRNIKALYLLRQNLFLTEESFLDKLKASEIYDKNVFLGHISSITSYFDIALFYPVCCTETLVAIKSKNNFFHFRGTYKVLIVP